MACISYVFDPGFRDWATATDQNGNAVYLVGFGNQASTTLPASAIPSSSLVFSNTFTSLLYLKDCQGCSVGYVFQETEGPAPEQWMSQGAAETFLPPQDLTPTEIETFNLLWDSSSGINRAITENGDLILLEE